MTKIYVEDGELPSIHISSICCTHCVNEVEIKDGHAYCRTCRVMWDSISEDRPAVPDPNYEDAETECGFVRKERGAWPKYHLNGETRSLGPIQPCILPCGHDGNHMNPRTHTVTVDLFAGLTQEPLAR